MQMESIALTDQMTPEQAKKVLEEAEKQNLEAFNQELIALQKKYNVHLEIQQNIVVVKNAA